MEPIWFGIAGFGCYAVVHWVWSLFRPNNGEGENA